MTAHQGRRFKVVEGWERLPDGFSHADCAGVGTDAQDNVYLLTRAQPQVSVYGRDGAFLRSWGMSWAPRGRRT